MPGREETFQEVCNLLEGFLSGPTRRDVLAEATGTGSLEKALGVLRKGMRSHAFPTAGGVRSLKEAVKALEERTRGDGFQVLRDWDGKAGRLNREIIPVDMLDYFHARVELEGPEQERALATLLDYYFLYLLALAVLRVWDDGHPTENLRRLNELVEALQGSDGSGHRFVDDAETLLWIAVSAYHPDTDAYFRLLEKARELEEEPRDRLASITASIMGSHLRWGLVALYQESFLRLRKDNDTDYPWLLFALAHLVQRYDGMLQTGVDGVERREVAGAILNGLTSDPPGFTGDWPRSLEAHREEYEAFADLYLEHRDALLEDFRKERPNREHYSPLSFHFNFPHNVLKAMVATALWGGRDSHLLPLNALVTRDLEPGARGADRERLARSLMMDFGRASPERTTAGEVVVIVYDPRVGLDRFNQVLRESVRWKR